MQSLSLTLLLAVLSVFGPPDFTQNQTNNTAALDALAVSMGHNYYWTNGASDYKVDFTYDEIGENRCDCNQTGVNAKFCLNSFRSAQVEFNPSIVAPSGSFTIYPGPGYNQTLYLTTIYNGTEIRDGCLTCDGISPCDPKTCNQYTDANGSLNLYTASIRNPANVTFSNGSYDTKIVVAWDKGTDLPDGSHGYKIYKNNVLDTTLAGTARSYEDTGLSPGVQHSYRVTTYTTSYGTQESSGVSGTGATFDIGVDASDGTSYNKVSLSWNDISAVCEEIRIERTLPESTEREEIAIVSKNATAYSDQDGIDGYVYTYYVTPISQDNTFLADSDTGYSKPNGKITGHVKSQLNAGVYGVDINVRLLTTIPTGGAALPTCDETYCATTDAEGYFEIKDIYYYDGAEFEIVPMKMGTIPHEFTPDTITRSMDENGPSVSGVDFTDLTVFTVGGFVGYPESSNMVTCGIQNVSILLDGLDYGIMTDADGNWSFAIQDEGTYEFTPKYLHHAFEDPSGDTSSVVYVSADDLTIDFEDVETDSLQIVVQGGCGASLGDSVEVRITSPNNCFDETHIIDENGLLTIYDLPARDYSVEVTDIFDQGNSNLSNILAQIGGIPIDIDLTVRDTLEQITENRDTTITPTSTDTLPNGVVVILAADTVVVVTYDTAYLDIEPMVQFIYRSPLVITTDFVDAGAEVLSGCENSEGEDIILMEQGLSYTLQFHVAELLGDCDIDTGYLKIYDFISDRGGNAIEIPISGGYASYVIQPGEPIVASNPTFHDHEKLLYVIPEVDLLDPEPLEYWVFVTGSKSNTPSFITRTPDIPMVILHDPPGDQSYSFIEEGTSFTSFTTNEVLVGGDAGVYLNLLLGAKVLTPFSGNGFGTQIKFEAVAGQDAYDRNGIYTTVTFNQRFSTSDLENLTGNEGDVYVGAAFNQEFSLAEVLTFDYDSCKGDVDIVPSIAVEDFATTFVYTEKHIRNTLLPTIGFIKDNIIDGQDFTTLSLEDQAEVNNLIADSILWENILTQNSLHRDSLAEFEENISFSAGAPLSREYSTDSTSTIEYEYNTFVNSDFALGAKIDNESGIWFDSELGVMGSFRWSSTVNEGSDSTRTRTTGYVLDDNDIGDFFSVDVLTDTAYQVPAFRLKLGTSSCPQEPGTQARDRATIQIIPPEQLNIPVGEPANFICQITNVSESFEAREYAVRVISTTNPDGLTFLLGGSYIQAGDATFFLEHNQTQNLNLRVDQGPLASLYEDIALMIYPQCEYELWQDNGTLMNSDTAWIQRIEWQSECTNVALSLPNDGWLVNQQSNNIVHAAFTGYDLNNDLFQSLTLQIKKEGEGYVDQVTVNKEDLIGPYYDIFLDVSNFPDGDYRLRAKANCGLAGGITYSSELFGIIDRTSLAPFGIPTPSDGYLREGQSVSVAFDKDIDCDFNQYPHEITLIREDNGASIPFTTSCMDNEVIFNTTPHLTDQTDLEGVLVTARVHLLQDQNGNVQEYPTEWSFLVNVAPVFWDPDSVSYSEIVGNLTGFSAVLKNDALLSKSFSLDTNDVPGVISYPDWMYPKQTHGSVLSNNQYVVDFGVDPGLVPGIYTGTVVAAVDGLPVSLQVHYEVLAKPVNWPFDPNVYDKTMTVVCQFSLDQTNAPLSSDTRDLIAAFVNGEIRGIANIEYIPENNTYAAYLTVYGQGGQNGAEIKFRFWRALTGVEYEAVEKTLFAADTRVGSPSAPLILHPNGTLQVIPLKKGWNWISFNLTHADMTRERLFESLIAPSKTNSILINSQLQSCEYVPGSGWLGNLKNLALGPGYMVHLSDHSDTLRVVGNQPTGNITLPVTNSWNWIGFPEEVPRDATDVLMGLTHTAGDELKSQTRFAVWDTGSADWLGTLTEFKPGYGYKLKLGAAGSIVYRDPSEYAPEYGNFESTMNLLISVDKQSLNIDQSHLTIGAFVNNQCQGVAEMEYVEVLNAYRGLLMVMGNAIDEGREIELRVLDQESGREYLPINAHMPFRRDEILGDVFEPYVLYFDNTLPTSGSYQLWQTYPNPTTGEVTFRYDIANDEEINLSIWTPEGELIRVIDDAFRLAGEHTISTDLSGLTPGVYLYTLTSKSFTGTRKLIVM